MYMRAILMAVTRTAHNIVIGALILAPRDSTVWANIVGKLEGRGRAKDVKREGRHAERLGHHMHTSRVVKVAKCIKPRTFTTLIARGSVKTKGHLEAATPMSRFRSTSTIGALN